MKKDLIFIGIQGSGKGTQAKLLAEKEGYQIFETGGALRKMATEDSPLGQKVKSITQRGDLVPNEIVMDIVENFIQKIQNDTPIIFDGIPRSEEQRISLENLLRKKKRDFLALEVRLSEAEAIKRLLKRAEIEGRADDNLETIKKRIHNFYQHTQPLLEAWKDQGRLKVIDGEQSIEKVSDDIFESVQEAISL